MATTAEGVASWRAASARIETGGTILVELLLLLRIGQNLVRGLDVGEAVFRVCVFVGIGVVFLSETVVCLLDVGGGGGLVYSERLVWILLRERVRAVERLPLRLEHRLEKGRDYYLPASAKNIFGQQASDEVWLET